MVGRKPHQDERQPDIGRCAIEAVSTREAEPAEIGEIGSKVGARPCEDQLQHRVDGCRRKQDRCQEQALVTVPAGEQQDQRQQAESRSKASAAKLRDGVERVAEPAGANWLEHRTLAPHQQSRTVEVRAGAARLPPGHQDEAGPARQCDGNESDAWRAGRDRIHVGTKWHGRQFRGKVEPQ